MQVTGLGGLEAVINAKKWSEVSLPFQFPSSFTSKSFTLRKMYSKLLLPLSRSTFTGTQVRCACPLVSVLPKRHLASGAVAAAETVNGCHAKSWDMDNVHFRLVLACHQLSLTCHESSYPQQSCRPVVHPYTQCLLTELNM